LFAAACKHGREFCKSRAFAWFVENNIIKAMDAVDMIWYLILVFILFLKRAAPKGSFGLNHRIIKNQMHGIMRQKYIIVTGLLRFLPGGSF